MPEIAEAARIVHFLRNHLVGKTITNVVAPDDPILFGKVGTTASDFIANVKGKRVVSAGSQGKYFWLLLDSPPHPLMHFGMTGWIHIKGLRTGYTNYYNKMKPEDMDMWPPKYCRFQLEAVEDTSATSAPAVHVAFTDPRRLARIRLVDCPGSRIRAVPPLSDNGPDPVVDADTTFTRDYVLATLKRRHVPIKALLLDQAFLSGIGNWVGDEVLFQARIHPEQRSDALSPAQMDAVYAAIKSVCGTAVALLGESERFPADWLFSHRWGKASTTRKKSGGTAASVARLPSGEALAFVTVGGRTSCYAPGLQKKHGEAEGEKVEEEEDDEDDDEEEETKVKVKKETKETEKKKKEPTRKKTAPKTAKSPPKTSPETAAKTAAKTAQADATRKRKRSGAVKEETGEEQPAKAVKKEKGSKTKTPPAAPAETRRRSARLSGP